MPSPRRLASGRRHARRAVLTCTENAQLTWNTAQGGVPTLAELYTTGPNGTSYTTDYIMGPEGLPVEDISDAGIPSGTSRTSRAILAS